MPTKLLTKKEMKILRENPYTYSVSEKTLRFTKAFKEEFWARYQMGDKPRKILQDLGYDPEMLGQNRVISVYSQVKKEAESPEGFRDYGCKKPSVPSSRNEKNRDVSDNQAIRRLQNELTYVRQEMEFLKKIMKEDRSKK